MLMSPAPDEYVYPVEPDDDVPVALVPSYATTPFARQLQDIRAAAALDRTHPRSANVT